MPRKYFNFKKYASYDAISRKSTCLIETCKKELCGKIKSNIKRHYKLVHKQDIKSDSESDNEDLPNEPEPKKLKHSETTTAQEGTKIVKAPLAVEAEEQIPLPLPKVKSPTKETTQQLAERQPTSNSADSCQQIAQIWGLKLAKMTRMQRIIAEKVINEVMFNGELGLLNLNTGLKNITSLNNTNLIDPISPVDVENKTDIITIENTEFFGL